MHKNKNKRNITANFHFIMCIVCKDTLVGKQPDSEKTLNDAYTFFMQHAGTHDIVPISKEAFVNFYITGAKLIANNVDRYGRIVHDILRPHVTDEQLKQAGVKIPLEQVAIPTAISVAMSVHNMLMQGAPTEERMTIFFLLSRLSDSSWITKELFFEMFRAIEKEINVMIANANRVIPS